MNALKLTFQNLSSIFTQHPARSSQTHRYSLPAQVSAIFLLHHKEDAMQSPKLLFVIILVTALFQLSCKEEIIEYHYISTPDKTTQNDEFHGDLVGKVQQKESGAIVLLSQVNVVDSAVMSSVDGSFAFRGVRMGNYDLTVRAGSYRLYSRTNVIVPGGGVAYVGTVDLSTIPDLVARHYPIDQAEIVYDNRYARLSIGIMFTQPMDRESVEKAFSTDPPTTGTFHWGEYYFSPIYDLYRGELLSNSSYNPVDQGAVITTFSKVTAFTYIVSRKDSRVDTTYTVRLSTGAKDTAGNPLRFPLIYSFSTVQAGFTQYGIQTDPVDGDVDVPLISYSGITVTFPRRMDPVSTEAALSVTPSDQRFVLWPSPNMMRIYLGGVYRADTIYTIFIDSTARDRDQIRLGEQVSFSFRTAAVALSSTYPNNGELFVGHQQWIHMNFNTFIVKSSVEANFSITPPVNGSFVWGSNYSSDSKNSISFVPSERLAPNTMYRVTIGQNCRDLFGSPMKEPYTFSFVTRPQ